MDLAAMTLAILLKHCPPGQTGFSVEPSGAGKFSSFYSSPVVRETEETGRARYARIAAAMVGAAQDVLREEKPRGVKLWNMRQLLAMTTAVAIFESGLREDVQMGRGSAHKADDAGGRGRGPGGEACFMQIHPRVFAEFAPGGADSLLGADEVKMRECFRAGMRMLVRARAYCSGTQKGGKLKGYDWVWATAAMYGTGNSCTSSNHGKTALRVNLVRKLLPELKGVS